MDIRALPGRCAATSRARRLRDRRAGVRCSSSTTGTPTCRLLDAVLAPRGYRVRPGRPRARRPSSCSRSSCRRRPARHPDAGHGRVRGLPPDPGRTRAPQFLPVVMITASGQQEKAGALRPGPTTSSPSRSTRPSCWPGSRSLGPGQALPRHRHRPGPAELAEPGTQQLEHAWLGPGRRDRADGPAAQLPVAPARRPGDARRGRVRARGHRREIVVVFCDLRGFTSFAETSEPEEVMAVLRRVPPDAWAT